MTIGNVIAPKVMGDTLDLHPVTILLALIFWGMLWGIPGTLLATPITAIMKMMLSRMELTAPLSSWMAGRFGAEAA
jgi:AI-2 transport protein TqsA